MSTTFPKKSFMNIIYFYISLLLKFCEGNPKKNTSLAVTSDMRLSLTRLIFSVLRNISSRKKYANLSYNTISILRHPLTLPCHSFSFLSLYILVYVRYSVSLFLPLPVFPHPFHLLFVFIFVSRFLSFSFSLCSVFRSKVRTVRLIWYRFKRIFDCFTSVSDSSSAIYAELL